MLCVRDYFKLFSCVFLSLQQVYVNQIIIIPNSNNRVVGIVIVLAYKNSAVILKLNHNTYVQIWSKYYGENAL